MPELPTTATVGLLVGVRILAMVLLLPSIGGWSLNLGWRIGLSLALAAMITPVAMASPEWTAAPLDLVDGVLQQALEGGLLGAALRLIVVSAAWMGEWIGQMTGLGLHDPIGDSIPGEGRSLLSRFYLWIGVLMFYSVGGPGMVADVLLRSFQHPCRTLETWDAQGLASFMVQVFDQAMDLAFRAGCPILACLMAATIILAMIQRSLPPFNLIRLQLTGNWIVLILSALGTVTSHQQYWRQQLFWFSDRLATGGLGSWG